MRRLFHTTAPIDDEMTVLDLLTERWGDNTYRLLERWPHERPHVHIEHCRDFGEHAHDRFEVTPGVVERLLALRHIKGTPHWGYTEMRELKTSEFGAKALWDARSRLGEFPDAAFWFESVKGTDAQGAGKDGAT